MVARAGLVNFAGTRPAEATVIETFGVTGRSAADGAERVVSRRPVRASGGPTEKQLGQLLERMLAEADGDPAAERDVQRHVAAACAHYATARVRDFLLILIERDVRRRLSNP